MVADLDQPHDNWINPHCTVNDKWISTLCKESFRTTGSGLSICISVISKDARLFSVVGQADDILRVH